MGEKPCEVCGKRPAKYVCQDCGRSVCERCLEPYTWLCAECHRRVEQEMPRSGVKEKLGFQPTFVKMLFLGVFLIFLGTIALVIAAVVHGLPSSFGIVIFLGPIPIVIGAGEYSFLAVVLAVILAILSLAVLMILRSKKWTTSSA